MRVPVPDLPPEIPLLRLLSIAGHIVGQRWSRITSQQHGLTAAGCSVLVVLASGAGGSPDRGQRGRATHGDLARRCWIRPATLTGIVDTLERSGLVERVRDESDRRQIWIALTPAGVDRMRAIGPALRHAFAPTKAEQDPEKEAVIREYLTELITTYYDEEGGDADRGGRT